jgi:hypothetical protein
MQANNDDIHVDPHCDSVHVHTTCDGDYVPTNSYSRQAESISRKRYPQEMSRRDMSGSHSHLNGQKLTEMNFCYHFTMLNVMLFQL